MLSPVTLYSIDSSVVPNFGVELWITNVIAVFVSRFKIIHFKWKDNKAPNFTTLGTARHAHTWWYNRSPLKQISSRPGGDRAFSVAAPSLWNALLIHIRQSATLPSFKQALKTHLFKLYLLIIFPTISLNLVLKNVPLINLIVCEAALGTRKALYKLHSIISSIIIIIIIIIIINGQQDLET